jgi:hypothetical protein
MAQCLFTVQDTFAIADRGTIVAPGMPHQLLDDIRIGDTVELRKPDGSVADAQIKGMDLLRRKPDQPVALLLGLEKEKIPHGTEIWSK